MNEILLPWMPYIFAAGVILLTPGWLAFFIMKFGTYGYLCAKKQFFDKYHRSSYQRES